ncbi:MAG: ribulose-phosphate 3-epimerase [Trueperaceae bacterium]|nr:MAG: ribulose-phosphate 3-epimerase [Trueperaceae bacterium]
MPTSKIAPSILASDFARLGDEARAAEEAGADYLHIDVMDGHFVPNITLGPSIVEACRRSTNLPLDVHLMIAFPERYLADFKTAGADHITIHAEATQHHHRALQTIKSGGLKAGLAVNPLTPLHIFEEALPLIDLALIMSVNPGFGGQTFIEGSLDRITRLKHLCSRLNPDCEIEVDGGVSISNVQSIVRAGADVVIAGSAIYNGNGSVSENVKRFREQMV